MKTSYVLRQGSVTLVVSSSLGCRDGHFDDLQSDDVADHVKLHSDGVKSIALEVDDTRAAFRAVTERGANASQSPMVLEDEQGEVVIAEVATYGDTVHRFVERKNYKGIFMPGFTKRNTTLEGFGETGVKCIDHVVGNVRRGEMDEWADYYKKVFGFAQLLSFDDKDISTDYTALQSKVVTNRNGLIKYPINEPAPGLKKSQIEEFLDFYNGPGVQHIALLTDDLSHTVAMLRKRGCEFLTVPDTYYDVLEKRVGRISEPIDTLRQNQLLVDRDQYGYMLQIFTKPISDRPTLFFEIIQRKGALSFGKGNFKALFESIEREQQLRGTL